MRRRILVLGGSGFSGRYFINQILNTNMDIHVVDRNSNFSLDAPQVQRHALDLTQPKLLWELLDSISPHYVANFAGVLRAESFSSFYNVNVMISQQLLEWAAASGQGIINKVLLIGSSAEYGVPQSNPVAEDAKLEPINFYGLSKSIQSQLAAFYATSRSVPVVIARTFNLYGNGAPLSLAVGDWQAKIDAVSSGDAIYVGNLESERDYISIEEAVEQYFNILCKGAPGEVYNVCSGKPIKMRSILESMIADSGKNIVIHSDSSIFKSSDVACIYGDNAKYKRLC